MLLLAEMAEMGRDKWKTVRQRFAERTFNG